MQRLFIVGCPRSGTTMLQQALNRHSGIVIPPETKFFSDFYRRTLRHQRRHWLRIREDLQLEQAAPTYRVCTPQAARSVYDGLAYEYLARLGREDVEYFGDKTPEHTSRLHWLEDVFPDAKIIFLVRDGRDVALSLSKTPWMHCDAYAGFLIWLYYYRMLRKTRAARPLNVCFARYESIVAQPEFELRRLLQFLNLPYEAAVAHGHGNAEGIPARKYSWKHRALTPITAEWVGAWRRELPVAVPAELEWLGGEALVDLGYALSGGTPRGAWPRMPRVVLSATQCALRLPWRYVVSELAVQRGGFWPWYHNGRPRAVGSAPEHPIAVTDVMAGKRG